MSKRKDYFILIFVAVLIAVIIRIFFVKIVVVDSTSMKNTLLPGDQVLVFKKNIFSSFNINDIIIFDYSNIMEYSIKHNFNKVLVKRVIATNFDDIKIIKNIPIINNKLPDIIKSNTVLNISNKHSINYQLNKNEYFVIGDNYKDSYDSRIFGAISKKDIIGKVILILYPFDRMKIFK